MIGNDVVDLALAAKESNWRRKGFLQKIFTESEQELIFSSENPDMMVWRLWTMKEAAYKAHQRRFSLAPKFNPRGYNCQILSSEEGEVRVASFKYLLSSEVSVDHIHSEAISENYLFTRISGFRCRVSSEALKEEALRKFQKIKDLPSGENLEIQKCQNGIPHLSSEKGRLENPVSFAHHGRFSAFSIALS